MLDETVNINVGRDQSNHITIKHESVSRFHCEMVVNNLEIVIVDRESKNGTFINGRKIKKASLKKTDELIIGDYNLNTKGFIDKLMILFNKNRRDYSQEYKKVLIDFGQFQDEKNKLLKRPIAPLLIRIGLGIIVIAIISFFNVQPTIRFALIFLVGILSMAGSFMGPSNIKKSEELDRLKLEFEGKLVCPKCMYKMIKNNLTYWEGRKSCVNPNCNAVYSIE